MTNSTPKTRLKEGEGEGEGEKPQSTDYSVIWLPSMESAGEADYIVDHLCRILGIEPWLVTFPRAVISI